MITSRAVKIMIVPVTGKKDRCLSCMCFNQGNASWCDGKKSAYYDTYFERHAENPCGDSNWSSRKCNTQFPLIVFPCQWEWECEQPGCHLEYVFGGRYMCTGMLF